MFLFIKKIKPLYYLFECSKHICLRMIYTFLFFLNNEVIGNDLSIIIMGTGPSLKNDINKILENRALYRLMAVNSYCLDSNFEILKPDYYILADPGYYDNNSSGLSLENRNIFIEKFINCVSWKIVLILPDKAKKSYLVNQIEKNSNVKIVYLKMNVVYKPFFISKFSAYNKNVMICHTQNVLHLCLYYCIYSKFRNIYLFGSDHNWCHDITVTNDNIVSIEEKHCYEFEHHKKHPMKKIDGSTWNMGELFEAWMLVYKGYYELQNYALFNNVNIFNESSVSFIDAFERKSGKFDD